MKRFLSEDEWFEQFNLFKYTAFRFEQQREYWEPAERETIERFIAGKPDRPEDLPDFQPWSDLVNRQTSEGKRMSRVRVHEDSPTKVQEWLQWLDPWNTKAGEEINYLTRSKAREIGLLSAAGNHDWWLFDSTRLVVMRFDNKGHRVSNELITEPESIVQACQWRDLALHHATGKDQQVWEGDREAVEASIN